jgi:hypothetical protein
MHFGGFFGKLSAIAEALYVEREMDVFNFSGILSAFNFWLGDRVISIKTINTNIIVDAKRNVLWNSMKSLVNFIRHLTNIKVLYLAKLNLNTVHSSTVPVMYL